MSGRSHSHPVSGKFSLDKVTGLGSGKGSVSTEELTGGPGKGLVLGPGAEYWTGRTPTGGGVRGALSVVTFLV